MLRLSHFYNIFTTNHKWLVIIVINLNLILKLLFYPNNNNLSHKIFCKNVTKILLTYDFSKRNSVFILDELKYQAAKDKETLFLQLSISRRHIRHSCILWLGGKNQVFNIPMTTLSRWRLPNNKEPYLKWHI